MTKKEKEILDIIKKNPTIEQSDIAKLLNIKRSTVAVHISSLQKKGYLLGKGYIISNQDYVVGIGACNVDVYGTSLIKIRTHYDHPATIKSSIGGVMRNIICNLRKLDTKCQLITAYGDDAYSYTIVEDCEVNDIDISNSLCVRNASSGIFMQIQNEHNDMYLAICDMSILEHLTVEYIKSKENVLLNAKIVIIDPSLTDDCIKEIIRICKGRVPIYIDPISDNYAKKIRPYVGDFDLVKPNKSELESLTGMELNNNEDIKKACHKLIDKGLKKIVVSLGKDGILYMDDNKTIIRKLKEDKKMVNASGAGDALMAGFIYGEINNLDINQTIDYALAAGIAAIRSPSTINENMSISLLEDIIKEKKKK